MTCRCWKLQFAVNFSFCGDMLLKAFAWKIVSAHKKNIKPRDHSISTYNQERLTIHWLQKHFCSVTCSMSFHLPSQTAHKQFGPNIKGRVWKLCRQSSEVYKSVGVFPAPEHRSPSALDQFKKITRFFCPFKLTWTVPTWFPCVCYSQEFHFIWAEAQKKPSLWLMINCCEC